MRLAAEILASANGSDHESHAAVCCTLCIGVINEGGRTVNGNYYADFKEKWICAFGHCFVCLATSSQHNVEVFFSLTLKLAGEVLICCDINCHMQFF